MKISGWFWVAWAGLGLLLEFLALSNDVSNDTLTGSITSHIPGWILFMGIGWLAWHFIVSYLNNKDER